MHLCAVFMFDVLDQYSQTLNNVTALQVFSGFMRLSISDFSEELLQMFESVEE